MGRRARCSCDEGDSHRSDAPRFPRRRSHPHPTHVVEIARGRLELARCKLLNFQQGSWRWVCQGVLRGWAKQSQGQGVGFGYLAPNHPCWIRPQLRHHRKVVIGRKRSGQRCYRGLPRWNPSAGYLPRGSGLSRGFTR